MVIYSVKLPVVSVNVAVCRLLFRTIVYTVLYIINCIITYMLKHFKGIVVIFFYVTVAVYYIIKLSVMLVIRIRYESVVSRTYTRAIAEDIVREGVGRAFGGYSRESVRSVIGILDVFCISLSYVGARGIACRIYTYKLICYIVDVSGTLARGLVYRSKKLAVKLVVEIPRRSAEGVRFGKKRSEGADIRAVGLGVGYRLVIEHEISFSVFSVALSSNRGTETRVGIGIRRTPPRSFINKVVRSSNALGTKRINYASALSL